MDMTNLEELWSSISPGLLAKEGGKLMDLGGEGSQALLPFSVSRNATRPQSYVWDI